MTRLVAVVALSAAVGSGCRHGGLEDQGQIGAAAGEVMATLDEAVDGRMTTAVVPVLRMRMPDALKGPPWWRILDWVSPSAYAASCWQSTYTACSAGVRTRDFDTCTMGAATLNGAVTLTFSRTALCTVVTAGDTVTRTGSFSLTGPYGGSLAVTSPGGGQTLTKTAAGFDYAVHGIDRTLTGPNGGPLFDVSARTTAPLAVTGSSRADLKIVSGALEITHNLAGYKVTLVPDNLAWSSACNCAVSGTLSGTVQGGVSSGTSASITITGCGQATVTVDGDAESVSLDRCVAL
jgi:hypothetical protein